MITEPIKPSDTDFCLCDHEHNNHLPKTIHCFMVCPAKARQLMKPYIDRYKENKAKNDKETSSTNDNN